MRGFLSRLSRKVKALLLGLVAVAAAFFGLELFGADATLTWTAPTTLEDGSPLADLAGYRVFYSLNGAAFEELADVPAASTSYLHGAIGIGEHCYRVTAYRVVDGQMLESEPSNTACKVVLDRLRPTAPGGLSVQ